MQICKQKSGTVAKTQKRVTARHNCSSVTSSVITTMNKSMLKITRIIVCKCQYQIVTFAKIVIGIKMVYKHKTRKNQQTFYKCNMCNNTIKITVYCITIRKDAKGIKNIINAVDGQWLAYNYHRQIQGQTNFRSTFPMLRKNERQWILWCHCSQCDWSNVQSPQSTPFSIKYILQEIISE